MYLQRDIVLVQFPFTDLIGSKLRPALIISSNNVNALLDVVCMQVTSKVYNEPFFIQIKDGDLTIPLKLQSGLRLHKVFTVSERIIQRKISEFNSVEFENVISKLSEEVFKKR